MIEFYNKYFTSNYKTKIRQLNHDIKRLLELENIPVIDSSEIVLSKKYQNNLDDNIWIEVNRLYNTLFHNKTILSKTLIKFINKIEKKHEARLKLIDTFAGCGGLSLGLFNAGFRPSLVNEIEPRFLETYYFNHDLHINRYHCADIKTITRDTSYLENTITNIDLVVGGPPCQGFSMANRQRILDDPRNELYKYYLLLLSNIKPKFFLMENVKGMINKSDEILDDFHSILGDEYSIEMVLLNAKDFGIPQNRERVFVFGSKIKSIKAKQIIEDILMQKESLKPTVLKDALQGLPKLEPKRTRNSSNTENDKIGYKFALNNMKQADFSRYINNGQTVDYLSNHTNRFNNDRDIEIFSRLPQGSNSLHHSISDIMPYSSRNHIFKDKYFKLNETEVSKTITSHMKFDCNMYIHPTQARGLSPREAARIQTFPDNYIFMGANNNWYAQIGNAVPVKLAEIIGKEIAKYLD